ncbi:AAA domain-containing protein [Novosphingobium sp. P6W]|uniref:AAA domain-containing protein n=1 Tax=Novosphingobium sp. P6W TaxID=1609758 RepID=UPI0005C31309|nr:AAA domain-containing protein [Novosphingobium sp. P6W]AXB75512.1 DUF4011 domain-containing protein [Novosphingobium sp. P6W]KIS32472.1 histidine kinase [Novosphingobium sp. P6W]
MMRFCPNCHTERLVDEIVCEGEVDNLECGWDLISLPVRPQGWRPTTAAPAILADNPVQCANGHAMDPGDLMCQVCGEDAVDEVSPQATPSSVLPTPIQASLTETDAPRIAGWQLLRRISTTSEVRERFETVRDEDGRQAILTLYADGSEPDPGVHDVLRSLDRDHVPEIFETGRHEDRAFEVSEYLRGGTLADLGLLQDDVDTLSSILVEVGGALSALAECGLRHRDLRPEAIMVRARNPLDLVLTDFGSARLSEYDLDVVSPLEITRYTAPEAVAGGVAAASDWWSLGMILLEQVTGGECFGGADDQAFLINVLTNGAPIPADLGPGLDALFRGLLCVDRRNRWGWQEIRRWLDGDMPAAPPRHRANEETESRRSIVLAGARYATPERFALAAAQVPQWEEARDLLLHGELVTWMEEAGQHPGLRAKVRTIAALDGVSQDIRLALALKALNPAMPLVVRGEIVTPGWLIDHPEEGYALITGPVPDRLDREDDEVWLGRLKRREARVRERAQQLDVELDETLLRVAALSTSRIRLSAVWDERRRVLPDTDHPGLLAIVERRITEEEDFILLLSAAVSQFCAADAIVMEAKLAAGQAGLSDFDTEQALEWTARPRRELHAEIEARLEGFARSGRDRIDEWGDQFRLERRLPLARALVLLAVPRDEWRQPPHQAYIATLLDFYARRITGSIMRGPLTRMIIGKTTARIDLAELDTERTRAASLLDHILLRNDQSIEIDPAALMGNPQVERRVRTLHSHATLYRRDTGIDGLYLGFPFLVMQDARATTRPRIAPVLLWPVRLKPEVGSRGRVTLAFDRDREEVRLNPAFETLLGVDTARRWQEAAKEILGRSSVTTAEVLDAFAELASVAGHKLAALPSPGLRVRVGEDRVVCAAALFHLAFLGQAVMEDLRQLKGLPPVGTSLETAFRVGEKVERSEPVVAPERERYFTAASDPSQEAAVLEARAGRGLLVEGPPGTGKSQTIVNMVADAIGTGRSLLVVCQKQAALEVVHKRLDAAGLGERVVIVNDVNKDREPVIRAIREQLEALFQRPDGATGWQQQREQTAGRIEALEKDLDGHHRALHAVDEATGLSYRLVLGGLIRLAGEGDTIRVPSLTPLMAGMDPGRLAVLQEACGPLARLWLPAHFEGSALAQTREFGIDDGSAQAFAADLLDFVRVELERDAVVERTPDALMIEDPEPYRSWSHLHGPAFMALDDTQRARLARWMDIFSGGTETAPVQREIAEIERLLLGLPADEAANDAIEVARGLDDEDLTRWIANSDRLAGRASFWETMSFSRWMAQRHRRKFMQQEQLDDTGAFRAALHREALLRPVRSRLFEAATELGEPAGHLPPLRIPDLLSAARQLGGYLDATGELVRHMGAYPEEQTARAMVRAASRQAVADMMEGIDQGLARHAAREASRSALKRLHPWMEDDWSSPCRGQIDRNGSTARISAPLVEAMPQLDAYQRFRPRVPHLGDEAMAVFAELARVRVGLEALPAADLETVVRRILAVEAHRAWKFRMEKADATLLLEARELEAKAISLTTADRDMRLLNRRSLVEGLNARDLSPLREWEDITRLRGVRSRRLREFVERGADLGLMKLRPVWLVNPDVASRLMPLRKGLFDTVIFDEASQMPIEYALPTLYRSGAMIVSGDEKQMPPTNFFSSRVENDEAEIFEGQSADENLDEEERDTAEETWNRREIKDCPDLLQLAKTVLPPTTLQIHYRSVYRELIQFSNAAFYGGRLSVPARHPAEEIKRRKPVQLIRVDGTYVDQTNPQEAERVVGILRDLWAKNPTPPTVGVVTFNRKQADLIEEVLEQCAEREPSFRIALTRERDRVDAGEDMGFFVKNVENVQGDERDVIIFSSTFGRNPQGTFRRSFGVLGQSGGERRLNVAITRARKKVLLVTSMPIPLISDFLTTRRQASSPRDYLQAYFEYARTISEGDLDGAAAVLSRLNTDTRSNLGRSLETDDGLELAVAEEIRAMGWNPMEVRDDGAFGLDFAIEDPRTGLYGIGIECDAPRHPLLASARAREMWRPGVLRRSIPVIHRVSTHRWFHEPHIERERLRTAVRQALGEAS